MTHVQKILGRKALSLICLALLCAGTAFAMPAIDLANAGGQVSWYSDFAFETADLRVTGPHGYLHEVRFAGETPSFLAAGLEDGSYTWELLMVSGLSDSVRETLEKARQAGDEVAALSRLKASGVFAAHRLSGGFKVVGGAVLVPGTDGLVELGADRQQARGVEKAQVYTTDLIVQGSACIGFDCSSTQSFSSDTIKMKENNLRIHFNDTSSSGSFPKNDWRIVINDTNNGGDDYFAIEDSTAGNNPFRVDAGAGGNALRVDADGQVGIGTGSPVVHLHVADGNTPTLRLEQNGSDGFTSQVWDLAGNETNFFLRDVTHSSKLSFRAQPDAPKNSIYIYSDGDVGMGTPDGGADAPLHVRRNDGTAKVLIEEESSTVADRTLLHIANPGASRIIMEDTDTTSTYGGKTWFIQNDANSGGLNFSQDLSGGVEMKLNERQDGGPGQVATLIVDGSISATNVTYTSTRNKKSGFSVVDGQDVLDRLAGIEIQTWHYKSQDPSITHMGPIAEDFGAAFGLGNSNEVISATDANGVALAAIQGLHQLVQGLQSENAELRALIEKMASELE